MEIKINGFITFLSARISIGFVQSYESFRCGEDHKELKNKGVIFCFIYFFNWLYMVY